MVTAEPWVAPVVQVGSLVRELLHDVGVANSPPPAPPSPQPEQNKTLEKREKREEIEIRSSIIYFPSVMLFNLNFHWLSCILLWSKDSCI